MFSYIFGQLGRSRGFPQTFLRHVSMIVVKTSAVVSVASLTHISIVFAFCAFCPGSLRTTRKRIRLENDEKI